MYKCPKCHAPTRPMPPDGDIRYDAPNTRQTLPEADPAVGEESTKQWALSQWRSEAKFWRSIADGNGSEEGKKMATENAEKYEARVNSLEPNTACVDEEGWFIPVKNMSSVARSTFSKMVNRIKHGGTVDVVARIDREEYRYQCDGLKYAEYRTQPPQQSALTEKERERVVEKIAKAIAINLYHSEGLETMNYRGEQDFAEREWRHYEDQAQAALTAIEQLCNLSLKVHPQPKGE